MIVNALAKRVEISARGGVGSRVIVDLPVHRPMPDAASTPAPVRLHPRRKPARAVRFRP